MVFEMEHLLFWVNTSWSPGEESNQYHAQDLLAEKTLSITLNYTNTCSKFRASSYLILWKTTKEQAEVKNRDKLEKLCSERKGGRQKSLATLCLSSRRLCITWYLYLSNWDRVVPKWYCQHKAQPKQVQVSVNRAVLGSLFI